MTPENTGLTEPIGKLRREKARDEANHPVLAALRDSGQENRTLVVFTVDHGDCQGAHRWNQKTVLYEEAARKHLVTLFEAMGPTDPRTLAARRRLSSILFS